MTYNSGSKKEWIKELTSLWLIIGSDSIAVAAHSL